MNALPLLNDDTALEFDSEAVAQDLRCDWEQTYDQARAWQALTDAITNEIVFGGGAGGGKTMLGCAWAITLCLQYEGIRGMIGRNELKQLKDSTLLTFFDVCAQWGLKEGVDYVYHTDSHITFLQTGSTIFLRELKFKPEDPNYDRLGSTEYTFAFIDEAQQVRAKAKNVVRSRIRYRLAVNGLIPKMLMTCNPHKGFLYTEFYLPNKKGTLPADKKIIVALVTGNRFIDRTYISNLRKLDKETKERLLYGNWEYDDDPATMIAYATINDLFTNTIPAGPDLYIIADVARQGRDRTVLSYWEGRRCKRIAAYSKLLLTPPIQPDGTADWSVPSVAGKLKEWREQYNVPLSHVLADEGGMGGGVIDFLGCKGFLSSRKPFPGRDGKPENYTNLKTQCAYKLAELANGAQIAIECANPTLREFITEELEQLKSRNADHDGKRQIIPKEEMKEKLQHSPDFLDNLIMRMFYEFAPKPGVAWL